MKYYRIAIPMCPAMSETLKSYEHVGFRISGREVIHILVRGTGGAGGHGSPGNSGASIARGHGIGVRRYRKGGYMVVRSRGCILREILSNFYVCTIRVTATGIVAIVAVPESEVDRFNRAVSGRCRASVEELAITPILTKEEGELLKVARHLYETPRKATLTELATKLGIPKSNLSYKLRKILRKLIITLPPS